MKLIRFVLLIAASVCMSLTYVTFASGKQDTSTKIPDCSNLVMKRVQIGERIVKLVKTYPDELSFYGFNEYMVRGITHEDSGNYILSVASRVKDCTKFIKGKTCDQAAQEIMSLISSGLNICRANEKAKCGLC